MRSSNFGDGVTRAALAGVGWAVAGPLGLAGVALGLAARALRRPRD